MSPPVFVVVLGIAGCVSSGPARNEVLSGEVVVDGQPAPIVPDGWVATLGRTPEAFTVLVDADRAGWAAMHGHDYTAAVEAFANDRLAQQRAELALATYHSDLARVVAVGSEARAVAWSARQGTMPEDAQVATRLAAQCDVLPPVEGGGPQWVAMHQAAVVGSFDALVASSLQPLVGNHFDPCVENTLSKHWAHRVAPDGDWSKAMVSWSGGGLPASLFAPWLSPAQLVGAEGAQVAGAWLPVETALPPFPSTPDDDPEAVRLWARDLDAVLDSWALALRADASHDALDLLDGLEPVRRFRQEVLVGRARQALLASRPKQAMALLERARDASSRGVGPANSPSLFALTAEAHVRLGHAREALDALHPLAARFPTVFAAQEIIGDLAVLQGMDRRGDSKENP